MSKRYDNNLGDTIQRVVEDAVNSSQFGELNKGIQETIDAIFDEFGFGSSDGKRTSYGAGTWATGGRAENTASGAEQWSASGRRSSGRYEYTAAGQRKTFEQRIRERKPELFTKNPSGAFTSPIWIAIGGFFSFVFGLGAIATISDFSILGTVAVLAFLAPSLLLLRYGLKQRKLVKRFRQYVRTLAGRNYCSIRELATDAGVTEEQVLEDLKQMFDKKYFPTGHVDLQKTTLMLDDETYRQSLETQRAFEERAAKEEETRASEESIFSTGKEDQELRDAIQEGEMYIRKIREANAAIPGEEITRKLSRLEELMDKIVVVLSQKPDELPKLRKFMNYYMPTTDKLVQTYRELDAQPVEGENISKAKREIEETLDTINNAYEKLLDNFYAEAAMDVSSDISVLQNLMAQEGLVGQPFEQKIQ